MQLNLNDDLISAMILFRPFEKVIEEIDDIVSKMRISECIHFEKDIPAIYHYLLVVGLLHHDEVVYFVNVFEITVYY